ANLGALVEAEAADDAIGQADRDAPVLELAGLELGAHQDRGAIEPFAPAPQGLQLLADATRLLGPVPDADDANHLASLHLRPQRLAEPAAIVRDEARGGAEDVRRRPVVLFEPGDRRARKVLLEAPDVGPLRAGPGIDRLVVVADAADVAARLGEQAQPQILALVGV